MVIWCAISRSYLTAVALFRNCNVPHCRLYWSDPGVGSIAYIHLNTREKRVLVADEYSAQLYGLTVFQVFIELDLIFYRHSSYKVSSVYCKMIYCVFLNIDATFLTKYIHFIQPTSILTLITFYSIVFVCYDAAFCAIQLSFILRLVK